MAKIVRPTVRIYRPYKPAITSEQDPQRDVRSWEECEKQLGAIQRKLRGSRRNAEPHLLFRGQENSRWPLETTLERSGHEDMKFSDYYRVISAVRPEVETLTGAVWDEMPR